MDARTLEARLTARLVALAGAVLVAVGIAAVAVTERVLDSGDTDAARRSAARAHDAFEHELAEGDSLEEAFREIGVASETQGARVTLWREGVSMGTPVLPA